MFCCEATALHFSIGYHQDHHPKVELKELGKLDNCTLHIVICYLWTFELVLICHALVLLGHRRIHLGHRLVHPCHLRIRRHCRDLWFVNESHSL
jgi:hypothetical protein